MNFGQMKDMYALKKQADAMKKEMEKIRTKIVEGKFEIIIRGDQHIEEIYENGERRTDIEKAVNKAMKESHKDVAKKMKNQFAGMGFPGL